MIHGDGARELSPLVSVNCLIIPPDLLESELFGHDRGVFTGLGRRPRTDPSLLSEGLFFWTKSGIFLSDFSPSFYAQRRSTNLRGSVIRKRFAQMFALSLPPTSALIVWLLPAISRTNWCTPESVMTSARQ